MDLGLYEGTANVDLSNFYSSTVGCHRFYYYYYVRFDISIYQLQVASFPSVILQYGKHFRAISSIVLLLRGKREFDIAYSCTNIKKQLQLSNLELVCVIKVLSL